MKFKKTAIGLGTISSIVTPVVTIISCSSSSSINYDVGFAINTVSSLNYIKYKSSVEAASPLVESLFKAGPVKSSAIDNYLSLPSTTMNLYQENSEARGAGRGLALSDYQLQSGTLQRNPGRDGQPKLAAHASVNYVESSGGTKQSDEYAFNLNGKSKWSNGEKLTASNFIDGLVYILDINTGSQRINDIYGLDIENAREYVDAQNEYAKTFHTTYKNPFGYKYFPLPSDASEEVKKVWTYYRQDENEFKNQLFKKQSDPNYNKEKSVLDKLKNIATHLGLYGDRYSSHPHPSNTDLSWLGEGRQIVKQDFEKFTYKDETIMPFQLDLKSSMMKIPFNAIINGIAQFSSNLMPVNRNFIETHGGVSKFGTDKNHFISEGPFYLDSIIFGANGNMLLKKDITYHAANEIIPNTVKLYFQSDPVVRGTLFEDGFISKTSINAIYTRKLFSNPEYRPLLTKQPGFGMTGFTINLDKTTNNNEALFDPNFRKGLLFSIDRKEMLKVSGFDASMPSYSMLEPSGQTNFYSAPDGGVSLGSAYPSETIDYGDNIVKPIISHSAAETQGLSQLFVNPNQNDRLYDVRAARLFMDKYKHDHPNVSSVTVRFTHDSTPMMMNMALAFKSQLQNAFGGFVKLEIKGYPKSIYDTFVAQGKFQITWKNLDYLAGSSIGNSIQAFFVPDGIDIESMKTVGFIENPSGNWTFVDALTYYKNHSEEKRTLNISEGIWNKIEELSQFDSSLPLAEALTKKKQEIKKFFNVNVIKTDPSYDVNFDTSREVMDLVLAGNKIIMNQGVVLPVFRVDTSIVADRLPKVQIIRSGLGYGYVYDLSRRPRNDLPGMETKGM